MNYFVKMIINIEESRKQKSGKNIQKKYHLY